MSIVSKQTELLPTVIVPEFLSEQDLDHMVNLIMQNSHVTTHRGYDVNSHTDDLVSFRHVINEQYLPVVSDLLSARLLPHLGRRPVFKELWVLDERWPLGWHTDCHHVCTSPGQEQFYTIIIPLATVDSITVITDQTGWIMPNPLDHLEVEDYLSTAQTIPPAHRIPMDVWKQRLDHCYPVSRSFFTLHNTFEWHRGSLLAFDRRRWHASDNFLKQGLDKKVALVSFTNVESTR